LIGNLHSQHERKIPYGIFYEQASESFQEKREILANLIKDKKGFVAKKKSRDVLKDFMG